MAEFWDSVTQILVVTIPVIIGAVTSKLAVNSWQEKKEEFELKKQQYQLRKQILEDFENAYTKRLSILSNFVDLVISSYTINYKIKSKQDKKAEFFIKLPNDEAQLPLKKFTNEYVEFAKTIHENLNNIWKFFSTVRVYYNLDDVDVLMAKISKTSEFCVDMVHVLIFSKTEKEFLDNYDVYNEAYGNFRDLCHDLSHVLATKTMNKTTL